MENNYVGSFFRECASCLFANNTIVNCYQPPGYSNPTGLNILNVPGSIIVNNLFYNPASEPATGANTPYDVNFCNFSLDMPGVVFDYNYYTRVNQNQSTIRLASPYLPNPDKALWYNLFAADIWDSYRSTFPDLDTTSRADAYIPFVNYSTSPYNWAINHG